jgi:hypothetical protein
VKPEPNLSRLETVGAGALGPQWAVEPVEEEDQKTGISRQTEGHSFGDHLSRKSVRVTPSSMIEASIVLCSVSL